MITLLLTPPHVPFGIRRYGKSHRFEMLKMYIFDDPIDQLERQILKWWRIVQQQTFSILRDASHPQFYFSHNFLCLGL